MHCLSTPPQKCTFIVGPLPAVAYTLQCQISTVCSSVQLYCILNLCCLSDTKSKILNSSLIKWEMHMVICCRLKLLWEYEPIMARKGLNPWSGKVEKSAVHWLGIPYLLACNAITFCAYAWSKACWNKSTLSLQVQFFINAIFLCKTNVFGYVLCEL